MRTSTAALITVQLLHLFWPIRHAEMLQLKETDQARLISLHQKLVQSHTRGAALDSSVPEQLRAAYPTDTTKPIDSKGSSGTEDVPLTSREALKQIESQLKAANIQVRAELVSKPDKCSITYRPLVGGPSFDAGLTRAVLTLDPKAYIFSCACGKQVLDRTVDGTSDLSIVFDCHK